MDNNIFNEINSTLNLNGPILSFIENPTGATGIGTTAGATGGASVSFTGIATADLLGNSTDGTGYISYQWYEVDVGKLSDDTYIAGTSSTAVVGSGVTLTLSNLALTSRVGGYCNTTSAIDGVQFSMTSGNIDSGTFKMYGVS